MPIIYDAVGQQLYFGDRVAYVRRCGSQVIITERRLQALGWDDVDTGRPEAFVRFTGSHVKARPYNVVRLGGE